MTDRRPSLEDLLDRRLPSAVVRDDASLSGAGVADADIATTKDAVAAVGLAAVSPAGAVAGVRERLLASCTRPGKYGRFADRIARLFDLPIPDAEELMRRIEQPDAWSPFLLEGVEMIPVAAGARCAGAITTLVRLQPGAQFPAHAHRGDETMLVLDGGFAETATGGEEVWRGDELVRCDGTEHAFVGLPGVPCVAAAVITGYADFK